MLVPSDINAVQVTDSGEESGIPDRTISVLLNHLTDVRGIMCRRLDSHSGLFVTQAVLVVPRISQTLVTGSFAVKFLIFLPSDREIFLPRITYWRNFRGVHREISWLVCSACCLWTRASSVRRSSYVWRIVHKKPSESSDFI